MFEFCNYCWCVGNTSFRVEDLNYKNELQLNYLEQLFKDHPNDKWQDLETAYYDLLSSVGFKNGKANRPAKDARELTSGLADIGLVFRDSRKITAVGERIRTISSQENYSSDNVFGVSKDSYVYLLQLLKLQVKDATIRPFVALLFLLHHLKQLTRKEFTYLLPICMNINDVIDVWSQIKRDPSDAKIDEYLVKKMMSMQNYSEAHHYFLHLDKVVESDIESIGMNRKSAKYDKPVFALYESLLEYWQNKNSDYSERAQIAKNIVYALSRINKNQGASWGKYLSITKTKNVNNQDFLDCLSSLPIFSGSTEAEFRDLFFKTWHLLKWKSTLEDYYDLNKRYFKLTEIVSYDKGVFMMSPTAEIYFDDEMIMKMLQKDVLNDAEYENFLTSDVSIEKIFEVCNKTKDDVAKGINEKYGANITGDLLEQYLKEIKNKEFIKILDSKFKKEVLLELLVCFKNRNDTRIHELVSADASPSTAFEYIMGIIWYNLSGRKGFFEDMLNLTLDPNLLPVRHAGGNTPDMQFPYSESDDYPRHDMLMEVTLAGGSGQRHMEWEPVSRHLENHIEQTHNANDYVLFVSSERYAPTIKSFRAMKMYSCSPENEDSAHLKIIPLDCDLMKIIVQRNDCYSKLYKIFDEAFKSDLFNMQWFNEKIVSKIA
ncbi:MAG: AlwI family type II restriction endonuclease [Candidatus Enteromonas sp.]|nr:AlwI family type II restriction endonuclease [Candidatus Enteromonas sp.]